MTIHYTSQTTTDITYTPTISDIHNNDNLYDSTIADRQISGACCSGQLLLIHICMFVKYIVCRYMRHMSNFIPAFIIEILIITIKIPSYRKTKKKHTLTCILRLCEILIIIERPCMHTHFKMLLSILRRHKKSHLK